MIFEKRDSNAPSSDAEAFFEVGTYVYEKKSGVHDVKVSTHDYKEGKMVASYELSSFDTKTIAGAME